MPLTVKDILEKTFKRSFKGYDEDEVDRFLDQVIDEFKALQSENEALKAKLDAANERLNRISETETTIMNTLVSAQKSSERMLAEAARKAELVIDSAQTTARRRSEQTMAELAQAEKRLEEIRGYAARFAESFANMVNSQAASFEHAYRSYFGESEVPGGIAAQAVRRIGEDVEGGLKEIGVIEKVVEPKAPDTPPEERLKPEPEPEMEGLPGFDSVTAQKTPEDASLARDIMSLQEINKALSELEEQDGNILEDGEADPGFKPRYDDYSWLYDSDAAVKEDGEAQKFTGGDDPKLKSLIDEVID